MASIGVALELDNRQFNRALKQSESSLSKFGSAARSIAAAVGGAFAFREIIRATAEQQRVVTQLNTTLQSTGRFSTEASEALQDYAASLQQITAFGDEAIIGAQGLLLTFTQIGGDIFPRATRAILDMSTAMGTDLRSATLQLGKALNDPIRGVGALAESGIQFSEAQREMIKELVETNRVAEAQAIILKELETQFGGSAEAARGTLGGALEALNNAFGDLLEGDGGSVNDATVAIEELTAVLSSPEIQQGAQTLVSALATLAQGAAIATTEFVELGERIAFTLANITGNLSPLDELDGKIKEIQDTLEAGFFNRPIKFLFTGDAELEARLAELIEQRRQLVGDVTAPEIEVEAPAAAAEAAAAAVGNALQVDIPAPTGLEILDEIAELTQGVNRLDMAYGDLGNSMADIDSLIDDVADPDGIQQTLDMLDELNLGADPEADPFGLSSLSDIGIDDFNPMAEAASEAFDQMRFAAQGFIDDFTGRLVDGLFEGKMSFEDFGKDILKTITKILLNQAFTQFFSFLTGGLGGGSGGGGILGSIFGGFLADGGRANANTPYIVGEQGPELFVPQTGGTVVPNGDFGGGGGGQSVVNYNISAVDARSFQQLVAQDPEFIYSVTQRGARRMPR